MRPAGIDVLAAVRAFLEGSVLPGVAQEQRSELRAAIKLLRGAEIELDESPAVLEAETAELWVLVQRARAVLAREIALPEAPAPRSGGFPAPNELRARHADACATATAAVLALQEHVRAREAGDPERESAAAILADLYATLGRHAERRIPWQSVFLTAPLSRDEPESS